MNRKSYLESVSIGKFQIFATYSYAKAKLGGMKDNEAKAHGYMIAVMGARGGFRMGNIPKVVTDADIKNAATKKPKAVFTPQDYETKVEDKLRLFYDNVFLPAIQNCVKKGFTYEQVKALANIPKLRGAKISGMDFYNNFKDLV